MTEEEEKRWNLTNESPKGMGGAEPEYSAVAPETHPVEGVGVTPASTPKQKIDVSVPEGVVTESQLKDAKQATTTMAPSITPKPSIENMPNLVTDNQLKEAQEHWWLSGETEDNGVKRLITLDDVLNSDPSLKSTLKGGDFLYNILNYRKEHNMPELGQESYRIMLGKHSMDKTAKQEKRAKVRHFFADAIQPVADVLKAAVAYGYGKAGRTFIPAGTGKGNEPGLGDRMRKLEEVRAAQNWDAWADTFQKQERERLQQEAEARRAAARQQQREEGFEDFERRERYKAEHKPPRSAVERMKESQANAYLDYVGRGMSHEDAAIAAGLIRRGKSGGSGSGRGKSPAYPYYVGDRPYSQEHFDDAVLHALSLEYPKLGTRELAKKLKDMSPEAKTKMFKKHGRIVK